MPARPEAAVGERPEVGGGAVPRHVAIIMDGNGRWATRRGLPRTEGHRRGLEALRRVIRHAGRRGIRFLTIYSFSSENWSRPAEEIRDLMALLRLFIRRDLAELHANDVRVRVIGDRVDLQPDLLALLEEAEAVTRDNRAMELVVAFNYGARQEIARAVRRIVADVTAGRLDPEAVDAAAINARLDTHGLPDPDLVIRTSGEQRLSNFLLWQAAYAELVFSPVLWPDFDEAAFDDAIEEFHGRERRFGGVTARSAG